MHNDTEHCIADNPLQAADILDANACMFTLDFHSIIGTTKDIS